MKRCYLLFLLFSCLAIGSEARAQAHPDTLLPVRGLAIAAPVTRNLDSFVRFIHEELVPRKVNTLVLRIDFNYRFRTHPELVDGSALSEGDVTKIVAACKQGNIRLIPQINLLGHQSWAGQTGKLLQVYPAFDETPHVAMPVTYTWPNADSLYCKSYCPLHPDVHKVVFDLVDEICTVFQSSAFHAGMDEVFYLGDARCPRCKGRDRSELFAGEVRRIRDHLQASGRQLWIWGDRLIDGRTTGIGMWEGSFNDTYRAIDAIPKDVVICDWHYERADKTPVLFASKGLTVLSCSWNRPRVAAAQVRDMLLFRKESAPSMRHRFAGVMETVWSPVSVFLRDFYGSKEAGTGNTPQDTFRTLFQTIEEALTAEANGKEGSPKKQP